MSGIFEKCSASLDIQSQTADFLKCMSDEIDLGTGADSVSSVIQHGPLRRNHDDIDRE